MESAFLKDIGDSSVFGEIHKAWFKGAGVYPIEIRVHTDAEETAEKNLGLSELQAEAIRDYPVQ